MSRSKHTFIDFLQNATILDRKNNARDLDEILNKNKLIALYFSGHFCPSCRTFTPALIKAYENWKANDQKIEIIFVSCDDTEKHYQAASQNHLWKKIDYKNKEACDLIADHYNIKSIPQLWVFDNKGNLITKKGKEDVSSKGEKAISNWIN